MELTETLAVLNKRLREHFGIDTSSANPMYRVIWSEDQLEKRLTKYTKEGLELITPMVIECKKYQYIKERYVLERLVAVPSFQQIELADEKLSYEPIWTFEDKNGNYLPPKWEPCKFVIDLLDSVRGKSNMAKYIPAEHERNDFVGQGMRADKIEEELFGNETSTGDALAHKEAIIVPRNFEKSGVE